MYCLIYYPLYTTLYIKKSGEIEFAEILPRDNIPRKISLKCIEKRSEVDYKLLQNVHNTKYFLLIHGTKDEVVDPQVSCLQFSEP